MREIRLYGSEGGGAARSPYPYRSHVKTSLALALLRHDGLRWFGEWNLFFRASGWDDSSFPTS